MECIGQDLDTSSQSAKAATRLAWHEGQNYYTLKGLIEGRGDSDNAYALVEVGGDGSLRIRGFRKVAVTRLGRQEDGRNKLPWIGDMKISDKAWCFVEGRQYQEAASPVPGFPRLAHRQEMIVLGFFFSLPSPSTRAASDPSLHMIRCALVSSVPAGKSHRPEAVISPGAEDY